MPVYLYSFVYAIDAITPGRAFHGIDVNLVFGNDYGPPTTPHDLTPADEEVFRTVRGYWTRFAATGNPNVEDVSIAHWPAFKHPSGEGRGSDKFLIFDSTASEALRLREQHCAFC